MCSTGRGSGNGYHTVLSRRRAPGALRSPVTQRPLLNSTCVRPFSCSASRARRAPDDGEEFDDLEELEDFDEFNESDEFDDLTAMIRNRKTGKAPQKSLSAQEELRKMSTANRLTGSEAQRVARFMRERRRIECALAALPPWSAAVEEYCTLKYAELEAELARCAQLNRQLEHEYCQIRFAKVPEIEASVAWLVESVPEFSREFRRAKFALDVATVEFKVALLADSSCELERELREEFLEPRASARRKIDDLLNPVIALHEHYIQLKRMFEPVLDNGYLIRRDLSLLAHHAHEIPERRTAYKRHMNAISRSLGALSAEGHYFRFWHLLRKRMESSCAAAWYPSLLRAYATFPHETKAKAFQASLAALVSPEGDRKPSNFGLDDYLPVYIKLLQRFYLERLGTPQPPRSPKLNIQWRQLDVMAPFDLVMATASTLADEVKALRISLSFSFPNLWSKLDPTTRSRHRERLTEFLIGFLEHRSSFNDQLELFRAVNWMRLLSENRLHALGEPDTSRERGLFTVPKPLSQDPRHFIQWTLDIDAEIKASGLAQREIVALQIAAKQQADRGESETLPDFEEQQTASEIFTLDLGSDIVPSPETLPQLSQPACLPQASRRQRRRLAGRLKPAVAAKSSHPRDQGIPASSARKAKAAVPSKKREHRTRRSVGSPAAPVHKGLTSSSILRPKWPLASRLNTKPDKPNAARGFSSLSYKSGPWKFGTEWLKNLVQVSTSTPREAGDSDAKEPSSQQFPSPGRQHADIAQPAEAAKWTAAKPEPVIRKVTVPSKGSERPQFWSHNLWKGPGQELPVHYCRTLKNTENVARYFLDSEVVGFDLEWRSSASNSAPIQQRLSLIQLADENRIALFHIALFRPAETLDDLVAPSLKKVLESPAITKVGVNIAGDSTRLKKTLGIEARGLFELSHLYKLVKYAQTNPRLIDKRVVSLSVQVEEHMGLPLYKDDDVRQSDWTKALNYRQVQCK